MRPEGRSIRIPLHRPVLVWAILAVNIGMFVLTWLAGQRQDFSLVLLRYGAQYGPAIAAGEYWRLVTPIFLHGGLLHLLFNSYALFLLGPAAESIYGTLRFGALYLLAGVAGSIASYGFNPCVLSVGASGALFGLMGALTAFYWSGRQLMGELARQMVRQMVALAAINLVIGFSLPNIDNSAHLGGLVGGLAAGLALTPRYDLLPYLGMVELRRQDSPAATWLMAAGLASLLVAAALSLRSLHATGVMTC